MRRVALAVLTVLAVLAPTAVSASAAPPSNDAYATPATLTSEDAPLLGDNLGATSEPGEISYSNSKWNDCDAFDSRPDCGGSVWYAFTAPSTADYTIDTCDKGTEVDPVLVAFEPGATVGGLTKITEKDDACDGGYDDNGSLITFPATAGTTYPIQVTGYGGQEGTFYLRAYPALVPPAAPAIDTRITRYQSVTSDAPYNEGNGTHSGGRRTATFAFVSTSANATFECALDAGAYAPCSSPVGYDDPPVGDAEHTFRVRSTDGATDATPAAQRFRLDATPPDTSFTAGPAEGATVSGSVSFVFASSERNPPWRGRCALDSGDLFACNGPETAPDLYCDGPHAFTTRALDEAGNVDPTPATRTFTVTGSTACAAPELGEPTVTVFASRANIDVPATSGGTPATLSIRFGTTAAYGQAQSRYVGSTTSPYLELAGLVPATEYHYELTYRNGAGATVSTGDRTFTTAALPPGQDVPAVTLGTPVVTSRRSARVPFTLTGTTGGTPLQARVFIDKGPATFTSPVVLPDNDIPVPSLPLQTAIDVVDLEPGTTYRYRVFTSAQHTALSEERTFTTPAVPVPPVVAPAGGPAPPPSPTVAAFRLKAGNVKVGALKRSAKRVTVTVKGVPSGTKLTLAIKGSKKLATAKATASKAGTATFKVKLSAKARKALKAKRLKKVTFTVTATPPGAKPSTVTITKRLR